MQHLLNKRNMAKSSGVGITAFDKWGIEPVTRKGRESLYDVASVVKNRVSHEMDKLMERADGSGDDELLKARIRLTRAQADAQELKNEKERGEVIETEFSTFVLSRTAGEIASILDGIPLSVRRQFPELDNRHIDYIKRDIVKAMNIAAGLGDIIPALLDEYLEKQGRGNT